MTTTSSISLIMHSFNQYWLTSYIDYLAHQKMASPLTCRHYTADIRQFLTYIYLHHPLLLLKNITVTHCRNYLRDHHHHSPQTLARRRASNKGFWAFLSQKEVLDRNIWAAIRTPKQTKCLPALPPPTMLHNALDQLPTQTPIQQRDKLILETLYATGIRVSECHQLNTCDIDMAEQTLRIHGKGDKERLALFGPSLSTWLTRYLDITRPQLKSSHSALFLNTRGQRLSVRGIQRVLSHFNHTYALCETLTPHTLRHAYATALYNGGAHLRTIQDLLGHQSITTTQLYTQIGTDKLSKTFQKNHPRERRQPDRIKHV